MLAFLLAAEVIAATAVVSEAALIYVARKRNMMISLAMLALEAGTGRRADPDHARTAACRRHFRRPDPAIALCVALGFASIAKSLAAEAAMLGAPVSGWRWDLAWAAAAGVVVGLLRAPAASRRPGS